MTEQTPTTSAPTPSPATSSAPTQSPSPAPASADADLLAGLPTNSEETLRFDPFEYLGKKLADPSAGKNIQPVDGSESEDPLAPAADEGDPLAQGDPADVTPANAPQAPQDMAAVLEQMAVMRAELDQFRSGNITPPNGQNGTNAAPAPQIPDGQPKIPDYMFDVPDQIMAAMASEDPVQRKEGVKHLLGGIGRTIHRNLVQELTRAQAQIPQIVQGIVKEQAYQQKIHDDFYGNYKELNAPHLIPVVTATFAELLQQGKITQGWNDKNRDTIAKEVYRRLGRAFPVKGQPAVPPKAPVPPRMIGGNRAPGAGTPLNNTADEIARTFS